MEKEGRIRAASGMHVNEMGRERTYSSQSDTVDLRVRNAAFLTTRHQKGAKRSSGTRSSIMCIGDAHARKRFQRQNPRGEDWVQEVPVM